MTPSPELRTLPRLLAPILGVLLVSCASYPERTAVAMGAFREGHLEKALEEFRDADTVGSRFLAGAESGTVALVAGRWEEALADFERAAAVSRALEDRTLADPASLGETLLTWTLNDAQRTYRGEGFERVYLHCGMALSYLALGKLDDVYVEARRANRLLEAEEVLYEKKYEAGGFGHLISALAYELLGEYGDAYIDYQRMVEKGVGVEVAGPALVRLAERLGRSQDFERYGREYGEETPSPDAARVVVLAGIGLGPEKVEGKLVLPTEDGVLSFSGVSYLDFPQSVSGLRVRVGEATSTTSVVEDVSKVARENLEDRQLWAFARTVVRGIAKRKLTQRLEKKYGDTGRLVGDLFSILSERADLRCWRTLPNTWQATWLFVEPGIHAYSLEALGGQSQDLGSFELEPGETLIILARTVEGRLYAHVLGGRPIGATP
ncbi:MAG TPA: hypothetical protein ENJ09_00515 [Planctomycetes bacterium]|nr:hypothetical protein [Planctomycetota bacterium]